MKPISPSARYPLVLLFCVVVYSLILTPFTRQMAKKPFAERLGALPRSEIMKFVSADQKCFVSSYLIFKVLVYFGGIIERAENKVQLPADYPAISRTLHLALKLDPYNMDGYYFAQAVFTWDVGKVDLVNNLLIEGMQYRDWDWYLPYFVGFNNAYFKKDFAAAAKYYRRAGELAKSELLINLAGRYTKASGQTEDAIVYLSMMEHNVRNEMVRRSIRSRLEAFRELRTIEIALEKYKIATGESITSVDKLVSLGYLKKIPHDPYGGTFYIDENGAVGSSSKFAFGVAKPHEMKGR